jgi:hypothetical protein
MPLEILHGAFVLFSSGARFESTEIAALAGFRIHFARIQPILSRLQFADHGSVSFSLFMASIVIAALLFLRSAIACRSPAKGNADVNHRA